MTMPHLMNCSHISYGWCLDCVGELHAELAREHADHKDAIRDVDALVAAERKRCAEVFNMARICAESHMRRGDDCGDLARRLLGALTGLRA